jgi:hypothetical protein
VVGSSDEGMGIRMGRSWWGLAATAVILAGCFAGGASSTAEPVGMTESDLVGTWQDRSGAVIVFDQDGDFTATNLPYQEFPKFEGVLPPGFEPEADQLPASGWWSLSPPLGAPSGPDISVDLHVRELAGHPSATGLHLRSEKDGANTVLTFYIGDPDLNNRFVYEKCAGAWSDRSPNEVLTRSVPGGSRIERSRLRMPTLVWSG